jgi:hypothetical protein
VKVKKSHHSNSSKVAIFFVLIAFLFSQAAPYLTFKAQQYWVKKEMKTRIKSGVPESELTTFKVSEVMGSKSFRWEKYGKEFFYLGNVFDIVNTKSLNGQLYYKCINDKQEKQLFSNLEDLINQATGKSKEHQGTLKNTFLSLFELSPIYKFHLDVFFAFEKTFFPDKKIDSILISITTPPPNRII